MGLTGGFPSAPTILCLGLSNTKWGIFNLPLDLGIFGATGCTAYQDFVLLFPTSSTNLGKCQLGLPIPVELALYWIPLYMQWMQNTNTNPFGWVVSDAGMLARTTQIPKP